MHPFKDMPRVATTMVVAQGASVCYVFATVWPALVFPLYTSDLSKEGYLCCVAGSETSPWEAEDKDSSDINLHGDFPHR
jgi:hypothetical protein